MFIGRVVGTVWATKKVDNVKSLRFLMIHPVNIDKAPNTNVVVVADTLGAGIGELVICSYGHAARRALSDHPNELSIEAAVIGIVDEIEVDEKLLHGLETEKLRKDFPAPPK
ncbi:EutN/CcmL family microcompartment protein [bacterium]|nr:EutN/CcmL family microcompartment protein [bacterium]